MNRSNVNTAASATLSAARELAALADLLKEQAHDLELAAARPHRCDSGGLNMDRIATLKHYAAVEAEARAAANDSPASCAARLHRTLGARRALIAAGHLKAEHPEYSPARCFYDEAERILERGIVEARQQAGAA